MNIAFFTEGGYTEVDRNQPMRTDQSWVCALKADHHPIPWFINKETNPYNKCKKHYDMGVVIIPKTTGGNTGARKHSFDRENLSKQNYPLIKNIKLICDKVLVMQESTHFDFQEDSVEIMIWYYNQLVEADGILCHNDIDIPYYKGITNNPSFILPTLMIEDNIKTSNIKEDKVFVAGNWHTTYRGFDAWVIGNEFNLPMYGFKSGKFKQNEELNGINYLPWMDWFQFMFELSKCKYGVQTYQASAGQFPLNCAYLGIPCIGYNDVNTQKDLFPDLSVERGDILSTRKLANKLQSNEEFYNRISIKSKELYNKLYKEDKFLKNYNNIINYYENNR